MKRALKNLALWLLAAALMAYLYFGVLHPEKLLRLKMYLRAQPAPVAATQAPMESRLAPLMEEKRLIEAELTALRQEMAEASAAPASVFLLVSTPDEQLLTDVASLLDPLALPALMGVTADTLLAWQESGVPESVRARLNHGWELCLILQDMPAQDMQQSLMALGLPRCIAALQYGSLDLAAEDGLSILFTDGLAAAPADSPLWRVPALGNMHADALSVYEDARGTGQAVVYVLGDLRADQRYMRENLEALVNLMTEDMQRDQVRCLQLRPALQAHQQHDARLRLRQEEWALRRDALEARLESINRQITTLSAE